MSTSSKYKFSDYIAKQMKSARHIFHTNIMYIKASTGIKITTFLWKMGGRGCGSQNGTLTQFDLSYPGSLREQSSE